MSRCFAFVAALALLAACSTAPEGKDAIFEEELADTGVTIKTDCKLDADCDDGNSCTVGTCGPEGECEHAPAAGADCDDGNACTQGDSCGDDGVCTGASNIDCDDGIACTTDSCDPKSGCTHEDADGPGECDGSLCTAGDECLEGVCVGGDVVDCEDPDPDDCYFPVCNGNTGACEDQVAEAEGHPCKDGNPCTDNDSCDAGGVCLSGAAHQCESQHPCKTAYCNEGGKEGTNPCKLDFVPEGTPCDDGSSCTDADQCALTGDGANIQCAGEPVDCDDSNSCTLDTCDEESGCAYSPKADGSPCDVQSLCTDQGACDQGLCVPKPGVGCDDGVSCTEDQCTPEGECAHLPTHSFCDDGDECNGVETCDAELGCVSGPAPTCDDGIACTVDSRARRAPACLPRTTCCAAMAISAPTTCAPPGSAASFLRARFHATTITNAPPTPVRREPDA